MWTCVSSFPTVLFQKKWQHHTSKDRGKSFSVQSIWSKAVFAVRRCDIDMAPYCFSHQQEESNSDDDFAAQMKVAKFDIWIKNKDNGLHIKLEGKVLCFLRKVQKRLKALNRQCFQTRRVGSKPYFSSCTENNIWLISHFWRKNEVLVFFSTKIQNRICNTPWNW